MSRPTRRAVVFGQARYHRQWVSRLDYIFGEINAVLIAIAIGLAALDYAYLLFWEVFAAAG